MKSLRFLLPFLSVVLSSFAQAGLGFDSAVRCSTLPEQISFTPVVEGLKEIGQPLSLTNAVARFQFGASICTGSFVSDSGHVLMASHCLEACAKRNPEGWANSNLVCDTFLNGKATKLRVEFMSHCTSIEDLVADGDRYQGTVSPSVKQKCGEVGDLAVVVPEPLPSDFECLKMKFDRPALGVKAFTIGNPGVTNRSHTDKNSDGDQTYMDSGEIIKSQTCYNFGVKRPLIAKLFGRGDEAPGEMSLGPAAEFLSERKIQTTIDVQHGSSGGPLIDKETGEIIGVASVEGAPNTAERECKGSSYFERLDRLEKTANKWNPQYKTDQLKCNARKALKQQTAGRDI